MTHTPATLIAFEQRVAEAFRDKLIRAPIHLCSDSQAEPLLNIFEGVRPTDWKFGTWRGHFVALLSGVPEEEVFQAILDGRSMFLMFREQRVFCSAIVGGILPIALGVAAGIKRAGGSERVHVFAGDMCARTGLFHEFTQYAKGHSLPIRIVIEDNGLSTNAVTEETWGRETGLLPVIRYHYERTWPHSGLATKVSF